MLKRILRRTLLIISTSAGILLLAALVMIVWPAPEFTKPFSEIAASEALADATENPGTEHVPAGEIERFQGD
jgi:ABC-type microcin C transport system permease subunit YejB